MEIDQTPIRDVLRNLEPSLAHSAAEKPDPRTLYAPPRHANALDPDRSLVIGGRGVGKSYWAAALSYPETRTLAAASYPLLDLDRVDVELGFHDSAAGTEGTAPSPQVLGNVLADGHEPELIWRSVLLKAADPDAGPRRLGERVAWIKRDPETYEDTLLAADTARVCDGRKLLVVFDALDRLATDWTTIRTLTRALARVALETRARKAIRVKLFMRPDQFKDLQAGSFPDFSKLSTSKVDLDWAYPDLYGLLFNILWRNDHSKQAFRSLAASVGVVMRGNQIPDELKEDADLQKRMFSAIAGPFMGTNNRRGITYVWLPKHLADAHGDTSPRSFLITLDEAAEKSRNNIETAIDFYGINAGVLKASDTRLVELGEDHPWIRDALNALEGMTVPCEEDEITGRWQQRGTYDVIRNLTPKERPAAPIQLERTETLPRERAILDALIDLGVIERRDGKKVNVPDIFRVAAKMKRKGGVAPRKKK